MSNYEITFIVDPVLSGDEIKGTAQTYVDLLQNEGCVIVHVDEMGLRQLAYPINKRSSGIYYCVEFQSETGGVIDQMELAFRRDERIMRYLTLKLDKYGVKYNDDKRKGLIGKKKKQAQPASVTPRTEKPKPAPVESAPPVQKAAPVAAAAPVAPVVAKEEEE
ncbi:MAG: 30S ribosomal protein S6 [Lewinellaceae bacterium]|nr:30S ribosomal protein S6 [Lewinella sp.]MCB9278357.1 30S ribosomal protein S6 [Lewinellaceae bacterium]